MVDIALRLPETSSVQVMALSRACGMMIIVLLRLAHLAVTNAFAALRLLPMSRVARGNRTPGLAIADNPIRAGRRWCAMHRGMSAASPVSALWRD
ncbi:hypothetical protein ABZ746_24755 [Streptomyces sp. NPDC020096]